jgi:hypothetical protein
MWASPGGHRGTTINRVRLRGTAGLDALSARLRAGRAIERAADDVRLPPGAILCVRRLCDPRPGDVSLSSWQAAPAAWARAVGEAIADLARCAARPAHGAVSPDAAAVIFDDRAQLLACLAADWCHRSISACWWWRALIGGGDVEAVLRAWLRHPAHIAAAIEAAARLGSATVFVARLPERETAMLLDAVVTTHALDSRLASITRIATRSAASRDPVAASPLPLSTSRDAPRITVDRPPWRDSAPEACAARLRADQRQLLGIALTLRRDPARTRTAGFVEQVTQWRNAVAAETSTPAAAPADDTPTPIVAPAAADRLALSPDETSRPGRVDQHMVARSSSVTQPSASPAPTDVGAGSADRAGQVVRDEPALPSAPPTSVSFVDTGLGGIFYLLNVALALGLFGDFTAPRAPRLAVSIWQFIALVADALLAGRHKRDPVWALLADLAGPDRHPFSGTSEWRLDPAWLDAFPEQRTWRWSADGVRVRVRHPAGFFMVDVPQRSGQPAAERVRKEVEQYRAVCSFRLARANPPRIPIETPLARWTRWHATYVRARLGRALDVSASRAGSLLLRHRARVHLSLTHVDVSFSLSDLPLAIRLSGLDRDPWWIPAADRIVSFRYE